MNPWYELFILFGIYAVLFIGMIVCLIRLAMHKDKKLTIVMIVCDLILGIGTTLFAASHRICFQYNDWAVLDHNIYWIEEKYGAFDLGHPENGKAGRAAYYIYTDNGPIMPDHLDHYYYMEYDEWGVVYEVYDSCQPGG